MNTADITIFTRMSTLAQIHGALNLGQGFPDIDPPEFLIEKVLHCVKWGYHQYLPMAGSPELREAIARKFEFLYGIYPDPENEITITAGATQAIFTAILALIEPGDEVIICEPAYDCYAPAVRLKGGVCVFSPLRSNNFHPDWDHIQKCLSQRTRLLILNSPHNPTGAVLNEKDFEALSTLAQQHPFLIISDEVYEHILFDGKKHIPLFSVPAFRNRCICIYSFGKTFHCTGWKIGYAIGSQKLMSAFRRVHQYNVFAVNGIFQTALAGVLENLKWFNSLSPFFQDLRDRFLDHMMNSRFKILPTEGTYFQMLDYSEITSLDDLSMAEWLTREHKLTTIPVSFFYHNRKDNHFLRICFAKSFEKLQQAAEILCRI